MRVFLTILFFSIVLAAQQAGTPPSSPSPAAPGAQENNAKAKQLIDQAAMLEGREVSAWVRPILLDAAKRRIAKSGKAGPARK